MPLLKQLVTFFGVSVAATLADGGTFFVQTYWLGVPNAVAVLVSYCCGGTVSYTLNRLHTFDTDRSHLQAGWRFATVMAVGFTLKEFFVWLFADRFGLPAMAAWTVATGAVFFWNYAAHKTWTFGERRPQGSVGPGN
jgi:putative flippase GtrA